MNAIFYRTFLFFHFWSSNLSVKYDYMMLGSRDLLTIRSILSQQNKVKDLRGTLLRLKTGAWIMVPDGRGLVYGGPRYCQCDLIVKVNDRMPN